MDFVDILESRIPVLPTADARARAWAQAILTTAPNPEELAHLIQTLITDERNRLLLLIEQGLMKEMK